MQRVALRRLTRAVVLGVCFASILVLDGCGTAPPDGDGTAPRTVTVAIVPEGSGSVDQQADGVMVTLTADPADGWVFSGWTGADLEDPTATTITVNADEVSQITANFVEDGGPPPDTDDDGIPDADDNCPNTSNEDQADDDDDGLGNACDVCPNDAQNDRDRDGVCGDADACPNTRSGADVDERGCVVVQPPPECGDGVVDADEECDTGGESATCDADCTAPVCGDGVINAAAGEACDDGNTAADDGCDAECQVEDNVPPPVCGNGTVESGEQCDDGNTTAGDGCDASCRLENQQPVCGDGSIDAGEACDTGGESATCDADCTLVQCGDGTRNATAGEECDDGNTAPGDGCDASCQVETGPPNDNCTAPASAIDGEQAFTNVDATTDGPDEPGVCGFFDYTQIGADVWFCYEATCNGQAVVSLCGSEYDTKMAVYQGCDCPTAAPIACNDDGCGPCSGGVCNGTASRVTFQAQAGQSYMIRLGGFRGEQGPGTLTIRCGQTACGPGQGDCTTASGTPGCDDAACCETTCGVDPYCCDVVWDQLCADESAGLCAGGFATCASGAGACAVANDSPGCEDAGCCNNVCFADPYCCVETWDEFCAAAARGTQCFLACGGQSGGCFTNNGTPGCETETCCESVCTGDPFCCEDQWDQQCADLAAQQCR